MMRVLLLAIMAVASPAIAQDHDAHAGHAMSGMGDPEAEPTGVSEVTRDDMTDHAMEGDAMDHGAMDHSTMDYGAMHHGSMEHDASMDHGAEPSVPSESGPPPRAFEGPRHAADAIYGTETMAPVRDAVARENGKFSGGTFMLERLEARIGKNEDYYLWDAQGWYGGDIDKLWVKSEGEGAFGSGEIESAEVQALWSHAIGPWFDLQAGARFDLEPDSRGHAVLGLQGLAPYMFEVDAAAFLSDKGDLTARIEAEYDQRITQRLILQPRLELSLAAQDVPERSIGSGVSSLEAGLRLRYEIVREFAPYVGFGYEARLGKTADLARAEGEGSDRASLLLGLRAWF